MLVSHSNGSSLINLICFIYGSNFNVFGTEYCICFSFFFFLIIPCFGEGAAELLRSLILHILQRTIEVKKI